MGGSRRGGGQGARPPSGKSHVAIGFERNTGTDPPREAIGPLGLFWRLVRPSVKYVGD